MSDIRDDLEAAAIDLDVDLPDLPPSPVSEPEEAETPEQDSPLEAKSEDVTDSGAEAQVDSAEDDEEVPQPMAWAAEMRQHWDSLPKSVRKYISERERQQHAYISRFGSEHSKLKKEVSEIEEAFKPFEQAISSANVSKTEVIKHLVAERSEMMRDPETFIKRFADHHKLDLVKLAVDTDWKEPPEVRKARWEMQDKERQLQEQRAQIESQQQEAQRAQLVEYIEGWGSKKPHFQSVRGAMSQVLPEIQQSYPYLSFEEQLEATYHAVMKHPHFASLNKPAGVPQSVKRAASGISGFSGVPTPTPEAGSIREALVQAAKETGYF